MKKIFTTILIALLFCTTIFADDFVVTKVRNEAKYKTSDGVFELLKEGDTVTSETVILVATDSELFLKGENRKEYKVKNFHQGPVEKLIHIQKSSSLKSMANSKNKTATRTNLDSISSPNEFVVSKIMGTVEYEASPGVWETLKIGTKVTGKTMLDVHIGSMLELKGMDEKVYSIGYMDKVSVGQAIEDIGNGKNKSTSRVTDNGLVEVTITPDIIEEIHSWHIRNNGLDSIKELPAGKNVIRLEASSWGYAVVELTWTESFASVFHVEKGFPYEDTDDWDEGEDRTSGREINKKYVQKILDLIKKTDFYNQSGYIYRPNISMRDGESWFIEANINGSYKSVYREMPQETFLNELGKALLNLAK